MIDKSKLVKGAHSRLKPEQTEVIKTLLTQGYTTASIIKAFNNPKIDNNRVKYLKLKLKAGK